jgi:hypothetical protein
MAGDVSTGRLPAPVARFSGVDAAVGSLRFRMVFGWTT